MDTVQTGRKLILEKFDITNQMDAETVKKFILEKLKELLLVFHNFFGYLEEKWNTVSPAELWDSKIYPWLLNVGLPVVMGVLLLLLLFWVFEKLLLCFLRVCRTCLPCCCCCCGSDSSESMSILYSSTNNSTTYYDDDEEDDDYVEVIEAKGSAGKVYFHKPQPPWKATTSGITRNRLNEETYIINCDGSDKPNLGGYYGALIRDSRGEVIAAAAGSSKRVDITVHELQGLEAGLKLAKSYGIRRIIVRTDSQTVVNLFKTNKLPPKVAVDVWSRILQMVNQLEYFDINHINRGANRAADELAKLCPNTKYKKISPSNFPERLNKIINEEKMSLIS